MDQKTNLDISLVITPDLKLSLKILAMNGLELNEYIRQQYLNNPVLDIEYTPEQINPGELNTDLESLDEIESNTFSKSSSGKEEIDFTYAYTIKNTSLIDHLTGQLYQLSLDPLEYKIARYIVCSLDEGGYFNEDTCQMASLFCTTKEKTNHVLSLIHTLEPSGIGARNLQECLLIQINQKWPGDNHLSTLVKLDFDDLCHNKLKAIAERTGFPLSEIVRCKKALRTLQPKPGACFSEETYTPYIVPDIMVVKKDRQFEAVIHDTFCYDIHINQEYVRSLQSEQDPSVKKYLTEHIKDALCLKENIEKRNATLLKIASCMMELQTDFSETGRLVPMRMEDVAKLVNLHVSTVSRAVKDKYIQLPRGVFSLKSFFTGDKTRSKEEVSEQMIKSEISKCIEKEDKTCPKSDAIITKSLAEKGFHLSVRTVAKYRNELRIPNSFQRKHYE